MTGSQNFLRAYAAGGWVMLAITAGPAVGQVPPGGYKVPNPVTQFNQLGMHGDAMGFNLGVGDDPRLCKHYQGAQRSQGPGRPYIFMSRSGNRTDSCGLESNDPGELLVVRFDSRETDGERLRTNKALRGKRYDDTAPPAQDKGVAHVHFNNTTQNGTYFPGWCHIGGTQLVDNVLVVPVEVSWTSDSTVDDTGGIILVDVSDAEHPRVLKDLTSKFNRKVGVAAATKDPATGKYLIMATGGDYDSGEYIDFWETNVTDLHDSSLTITQVGTWNSDTAATTTNDKWGTGDLEWQNLNFVRGTDNSLYLIGIDNATTVTTSGADWARMFQVVRTPGTPGLFDTFTLTYVAERHLKLNAPEMGDGDAAAGVYVSPQGNLILYTSEHENDGQDGSVRMGEFRNYNVNATGTDSCWGWVEIYDSSNGWDDSGARSFILDYKDRSLDNWDDLRDFEDFSGDLNGFSDATKSVRWAIPAGRSAALYADENYTGTKITLTGDGVVHSLNNVNNTISVTSLRFEGNTGGDYELVWVAATAQPFPCSLTGTGLGVPSCPYFGASSITLGLNALAPASCVADPTMFMFSGNYNQQVTFSRKLTLQSTGGLVHIGTP